MRNNIFHSFIPLDTDIFQCDQLQNIKTIINKYFIFFLYVLIMFYVRIIYLVKI